MFSTSNISPKKYSLRIETYKNKKFYLNEVEWNLVFLKISLALVQYDILFINVSTCLGYHKWLGHYPIQGKWSGVMFLFKWFKKEVWGRELYSG